MRWGEPQHATCRTHGSAATKEFEPNRWLHRNQAAASALVVDEAISRRRGQRASRKLETAGRHTCFSGCDITEFDITRLECDLSGFFWPLDSNRSVCWKNLIEKRD